MEPVFLAALRHLPPRQGAVLIFRDVLGRPVQEAATLMDMSVAASDSALQRARRTLRERLPGRLTNWAAGRHGQQERDTVRRCTDAAERAESMTADLLSVDVVATMPPGPVWFTGRDALLQQLGPGIRPGLAGVLRPLAAPAGPGEPAAGRHHARRGTDRAAGRRAGERDGHPRRDDGVLTDRFRMPARSDPDPLRHGDRGGWPPAPDRQPHWCREEAQRCFARRSDGVSEGLSSGSGRPGSR